MNHLLEALSRIRELVDPTTSLHITGITTTTVLNTVIINEAVKLKVLVSASLQIF